MTSAALTRRNLLKAALAAAAPYVITSSALGVEGVLPASERIGMGFIGLGGRGGASSRTSSSRASPCPSLSATCGRRRPTPGASGWARA